MRSDFSLNFSSFSAEEYMEILQLRLLDEDSTNGFFEAVFFLEDLVFLGSISWFV